MFQSVFDYLLYCVTYYVFIHLFIYFLNQTTTVHKRTDKRQRVIKVQNHQKPQIMENLSYKPVTAPLGDPCPGAPSPKWRC